MQASIYQIKPFDAFVGGTISFSWNGSQVFKNRCVIKDNETDDVVYDHTMESFKFEHPIDLSLARLENGRKYNAFITVFDVNNTESDIQQLGMPFLCLKTPVFAFQNVTEGQVIQTTSYSFLLNYEQENGELLNSWTMELYTKAHVLLSTSGTNYDTDTRNHVFSGFDHNQEYSVRAVGQTVNGMELDTGYINIAIEYDTQESFSILDLYNIREHGSIQIHANVVTTEGTLKNLPGVYINDEYLDLRDNEVTYNDGFLFHGDFSVVILFYGMKVNDEILKITAANPDEFSLNVSYRVGKF